MTLSYQKGIISTKFFFSKFLVQMKVDILTVSMMLNVVVCSCKKRGCPIRVFNAVYFQ